MESGHDRPPPDRVPSETSNRRPDGSVFPPVTPDPPPPPGYESTLDGVLDSNVYDPRAGLLG
jgi:hypothetical protein